MTFDEAAKLALDTSQPLQRRLNAIRRVEASNIERCQKARIINSLLHDPSIQIRVSAAIHAGTIGDSTTAQLLGDLAETTEDSDLRQAALASLVDIAGDDAIPTLSRLLSHESKVSQMNALGGLGRLLTASARELLCDTFRKHPYRKIRFQAAAQLALRGDDVGVTLLLEFLHTESWLDHLIAAVALSKLGMRQGLEALQHALANRSSANGSRQFLVLLCRGFLGLDDQNDEQVIEAAQHWVGGALRRM